VFQAKKVPENTMFRNLSHPPENRFFCIFWPFFRFFFFFLFYSFSPNLVHHHPNLSSPTQNHPSHPNHHTPHRQGNGEEGACTRFPTKFWVVGWHIRLDDVLIGIKGVGARTDRATVNACERQL
jgi:hypothetical protein